MKNTMKQQKKPKKEKKKQKKWVLEKNNKKTIKCCPYFCIHKNKQPL